MTSRLPMLFAACRGAAARLQRTIALQIFGSVLITACSGASPASSPAGAGSDPVSSGAAAASSGGSSAAAGQVGSRETSTLGGASTSAGGGGSSATPNGGATTDNGDAGVAGDATAASANGGAGASGAGASGAGASGAGASGAGGQSGSAAPCSAAFCEDFESGKFDPEKWTLSIQGSNTASVQSNKSAHGKYAAQFHYAGTRGTWAMALAQALPASLRTHHFGRASVLFQAALAPRHAILISAGTPGFPTDKYLEVASVGSTFQLTFVDLNPGGGESYASGGTIPSGRWFCMTWEFNDAPDGANVSVDGVQAFAKTPFTFNGKTSGLVGGFTDLALGFRFWGAGAGDPPNELYYDDLALDPQPLACPK